MQSQNNRSTLTWATQGIMHNATTSTNTISLSLYIYLSLSLHIYIYVYTYIHICIYTVCIHSIMYTTHMRIACIHTYIHTLRVTHHSYCCVLLLYHTSSSIPSPHSSTTSMSAEMYGRKTCSRNLHLVVRQATRRRPPPPTEEWWMAPQPSPREQGLRSLASVPSNFERQDA